MSEYEQTLRDAIYAFGPNNQKRKMIEEMAELTKELAKEMIGEGVLEHITEEMGDVQILLDQLYLIYDNRNDVQESMDKKLERLRGLIFEKTYG